MPRLVRIGDAWIDPARVVLLEAQEAVDDAEDACDDDRAGMVVYPTHGPTIRVVTRTHDEARDLCERTAARLAEPA